jgi:hypothetical protein
MNRRALGKSFGDVLGMFWGCFGDVLGMFWGRFSVVKKTTGTNKFPLTISL